MSFLDRLPFRWRKIGVTHITAAVCIIGSLKYVQQQHYANEERVKEEALAKRKARRAEREQRERLEDEAAAAAEASSSSPAR